MNNDLISRQQAIDALTEYRNGRAVFISVGEAVIRIEQLPSAQPEPSQVARDISRIIENEKDMRVIAQPEIIYCKDCKHWDTTWQNDYAPNYHYCPMIDGTHRNNFYCAYAERKEETT